jgi:transposase
MTHDLRALLRWTEGRADDPSAVVLDAATRPSTPASGARAGWHGDKRRNGSTVHLAVDTLGHLLARHVTPANTQEREQVAILAAAVQEITRDAVAWAFVDQGYTGAKPAQAAATHGSQWEVIKLSEAKRGFVLGHPLPPLGQRLRTAAENGRRPLFRGLGLPDAPSSRYLSCAKSLTRSRS